MAKKISVGMRYMPKNGDAIYILAHVAFHKVVLISLCDGNRWNEPLVEVSNASDISPKEWRLITGGHSFKEIKKDD